MSRTLAVLIALVAAAGVSQLGHAPAVAQDKKKDQAPAPPAAAVTDDLERVLPVFDPGTHTRPILAMGFNKAGSKLVTVGLDHTVQVWSAATGERTDIFRLPGYGHEKEYDSNRWNVAAVSADGRRVALGGEVRRLPEVGGKAVDTRLVVFDLPTKKVRRIDLPGADSRVESLAFAPFGEVLAVTTYREADGRTDLLVLGGLTGRLAAATADLKTDDCRPVESPHRKRGGAATFSGNGRRLLIGGNDHFVTVWDVPPGPAPPPVLVKEIATDDATTALAWAPDRNRFLRFGTSAGWAGKRVLELWDAGGAKLKAWPSADLAPAIVGNGLIHSMSFVGPETAYLVVGGPDGKASLSGTRTSRFDLTTGKATLLAAHPTDVESNPTGAVAIGGTLTAASVGGGRDVVVSRPTPGAPGVKCGSPTPVPFQVGWATNPAAPGFAWGDLRRPVKKGGKATDLDTGFDLARVGPVGRVNGTDYLPTQRELGGWSMTTKTVEKGEAVRIPGMSGLTGRTLVPAPAGPPLVAFGQQGNGFGGDRAWLYKADGTLVARLLPDATRINDYAPSPDGRFVIATTGTPRIVVHRTDGRSLPFLSFAQTNGEWVAWTPEGYYAASPGGEKMFGFAVNNGPNALVSFYPAERFATHFRRPDVIRLAVEKGSVKEALAALNARAPEVETILPPAASLALVSQQGVRVRVRATAEPRGPGKPVVAMRLLLDGRPLANGAGVWAAGPGPAAAEFETDVPPGPHELKLLARSADGSAVSDPVIVRGPKAGGPPPTLHRVCVGIDAYDQTGLKLSTAAKDSRDVFDALGRHCVGPDNRYGAAAGELILDKDATRERVKTALEAVGRKAKPGDLFVVFFAGHGVKKGDAYYLLTRESDPGADLTGKALSGDDLRGALAGVECPVLLALDACHSAGAARAFLPATDDATRALTDDAVGVTVLSAAMAHETAGSSAGNGHFTAGLLKGLEAGAGVPFDPYERAVYVHHLYSVVFSEVRRATGGRQNPSLNMPWTAPPLAVRDVTP